ncbi:N-acetylglucosamine kinase [Cohnella caldifontis]|uniref:N-acetylglucosamine kinase n=1 Tax=Cohnella caldifontis TaxID=3027471 RepID=UPI0023ECE434|nr:BadF/BadG/BcrA/BcrD ATPase family protein [Cohnella sp. YIM B05605]
MGFRLSIESGGTKMRALLFDESFQLAATGTGGGANANFDSAAAIESNVRECLEPCLRVCGGKTVDRLYLTALGAADCFLRTLSQVSEIGEIVHLSEGGAAVRAGLLGRTGIAVLAGTGSVVFGIDGSREVTMGGWGSWIGDEGSGCDIGRQAIQASIRHLEERGPTTGLTSAVIRHFGIDRLEELPAKLYRSPSLRGAVASLAPVVAETANGGDAAAVSIMEKAGEDLGKLAASLIRKHPELRTLTVSLGGSVWKGTRLMYDRFAAALWERFDGIPIELPLYEPVMGGVVEESLRLHGSVPTAARLNQGIGNPIGKAFEQYRYRTSWS